MQQESQSVVKELVLVGGGHAHAIFMRMWGMKPLPGVRLTLITDCTYTPYSGMLPGHVAGSYTQEESHIDLRRLAEFSQAQLYLDRAIGLNLEDKQIICTHRPVVSFDVLSMDIGSTPAIASIPGGLENAIPAKPVPQFLKFWYQLLDEVIANPRGVLNISIVGGGAGGVELALSMRASLSKIIVDEKRLNIHLFQRDRELLPSQNHFIRNLVKKILLEMNIQLHLGQNVVKIDRKIDKSLVSCESGLEVESNQVFLVTQASAPEWLESTGIKLDKKGFISVDDNLQSISHPEVFAVGDIATMSNHPRPKAGVFAVRQGKPLFKNIRSFLQNQPTTKFKPQKQYLSLIGTGDKKAIAIRGWLTLPPSKLLWRWKDYIDRKFMDKFDNLPKMEEEFPDSESSLNNLVDSGRLPQMHCAGCGSKVSGSILKKVLNRVDKEHKIKNNAKNNNQQNIIIGLDQPDDAAVINIPSEKLLVQTVDYFRSFIKDPYIFGQIATNHCLSDIFAMGATPQSTLAIATIPYGGSSQVEETLYQLLSGSLEVLNQTQTLLIGGHTQQGSELAFGLSCNGLISKDSIIRKGNIHSGQVLILTKALGTGTLLAANMRYQAKGKWIDTAVQSMLQSNYHAAKSLIKYGATACTDITGFGLLGHLSEMIQNINPDISLGTNLGINLQVEAIAVLPGALETIEKGILSSMHSENTKATLSILNNKLDKNNPYYSLLFDPQTSGGLLAAIPSQFANNCIRELKSLGYHSSSIVGKVVSESGVSLI